MNNASLFTADRTTHLKIVVVSLALSIAVIAVGITSRINTTDATRGYGAVPLKAGKPVIASGVTESTVR